MPPPVILSYLGERQQQDQWCWAAIAVTVNNYRCDVLLSDCVRFQQCEVVQKFDVGGHNCCADLSSCNVPGPIDMSLAFVGHFGALTNGVIPEATVMAEIAASRPIAVRVHFDDGGEHAVLICGYNDFGSGDLDLLLWDPARGERHVNVRNFFDYVGGWQNTCLTN